jgi:RNA polymerase sigma-70 factor, ECF subfamily
MLRQLSHQDEQRLIELARKGDGEAFGLIYDAFKDALYKTVIYPRVRDEKAAEEVLQDTFLLAIEKLDEFEWQGKSIFFWLRMIAINKTRELISESARHGTVDNIVLDFHPDNSFQPENFVLLEDYRADLRKRIEDIILEIPERYRQAIKSRLFLKKSREESAKDMDVSIETFDVVFFRACKSFRKEYIKKYGEIE